MGRGKDAHIKDTRTKLRGFRIPDEMWEQFKKEGDGNATRGLCAMYDHHIQTNVGEVQMLDEDVVVETVHKELTTILDGSLHKYFIDAVDFWIKNDFKPARIERYCAVFGVDDGNTRRTGQIMKRLEGGGAMLQDYGGFRPKVQCNNGLSEEKFLEYFDRYSSIVKQRPENDDLLNNIITNSIDMFG